MHLLTYVNGSKQGLAIFKRGLAGYEGVQEGLGVFAEWVVGGLTRARLRLLAARVVAVDAMTDGGELHRASSACCAASTAFPAQTAFLIAARVFRGGGFAKDAIYLRGFKAVLDMLAAGQSLDPSGTARSTSGISASSGSWPSAASCTSRRSSPNSSPRPA